MNISILYCHVVQSLVSFFFFLLIKKIDSLYQNNQVSLRFMKDSVGSWIISCVPLLKFTSMFFFSLKVILLLYTIIIKITNQRLRHIECSRIRFQRSYSIHGISKHRMVIGSGYRRRTNGATSKETTVKRLNDFTCHVCR